MSDIASGHAQPPRSGNPRLRLRVTTTAESIIRSGHPWLFAESIREQNRPGQPGDLAVIYDRKDQFLAIGWYDPQSPIRVRILHAGKPQQIDDAWWRSRLEACRDVRARLFDENTNGYRCINGESEGWPGLVLDRYADTFVLKIYTAAWLPHLPTLLPLIVETFTAARIVLRLSRNIQETGRKEFGKRDGEVLVGPESSGPVVFKENRLRFEADVLRGQKTGFFLDQRENRNEIERLAAGKKVLNAFSFSGGFSLYAARGGAQSVTDIDISEHALESSRRNFALNLKNECVRNCAHEFVKADAFDWLATNTERQFDLIILDPPSLAKRESERAGAIRAYQSLVESAVPGLSKNGVLLACSCSAHVAPAEFYEAVRAAARGSRRAHRELFTRGHAQDHPATFAAAEYLKAIYLTF
jgi:23S rRNA (cytosine1962-C5)-methyltransferase